MARRYKIHHHQAENYSAYNNQAICFGCSISSGPLPWLIWSIGKHPEPVFIAISAIATIFIAGFTYTLQQSTEEIGKRQIDETKILQRAYITTKPLGISPFISEKGVVPDKIVGHVAFVNVGRLPARKVSVERACMAWKDTDNLPEADLPVITPIRPMTIVLPPGTEMRHGTNPLPASDLERGPNPGYLYVWGELTYTDGFDTPRHIRFCHRYPCLPHRNSGEGKSVSRLHARYHQNGNDAD